MKKKLLLVALMIALFVCIFAISASAEAPKWYIEFQLKLVGESEYITAYVEDDVPSDPRFRFDFPFYSDADFTQEISKDSIAALDLSAAKTVNSSKPYVVYVSSSSPYPNCKEIKWFSEGKATSIGMIMFQNWTALESFDFGCATEVVDRAFMGTGLKEIVIPADMKTIKGGAFSDCLSLTSVTFEGNVPSISGSIFSGCTALTTVDLGPLTVVPEAIFNGCTSLQTIESDDFSQITEIKSQAFRSCSALTGTYEFGGVTKIGDNAFRSCATNDGTSLILKFPVVTKLGGGSYDTHVFSYSGIYEIYFGDDVASMGFNTFTDCKKLWKIEFAGSPEGFSFPSYTFDGCSALKAFSIPDSMTQLPGRMFRNCSSLTAVYLPSGLVKISSGSQDHSTFANCTNMYFVSEPFTFETENDIPAKPDVYYFPSTLTTLTEETFKGCRSLNKTLVFPTGVTKITNHWAFESGNNTPTLENIVFLGDMESISVSYWKFTGKIYLCNPADKSADDLTISGSKTIVYCNAEGNTSHLAQSFGHTIGATCTEAAMTYDKCFCGQAFNKVANESEPALGHIYEQNKIVAITYVDIAKNGTYTTNCDRCDHNEVAVKADTELFIYNGISTNGTGEMCVGYVINTDAINLYKQFNPEVTLDFGIVAAATDYIGENEAPLDKDGNVVGANVIKTELTQSTARAVDFKLKGDFTLAENAKLNLTMGMYVILNGKVSYIYNSETDTGNEASSNDGIKIVTYELVSSRAK